MFCGRERNGVPRRARCSRDGVGSWKPRKCLPMLSLTLRHLPYAIV